MRSFNPAAGQSPGKKSGGKLTVVGNVYHHRPNRQPTGVESRYERRLSQDLAPHEDEFAATSEWQPIQTGRVRDVSVLVVENLEGSDLEKVPTPEEEEDLRSRVLELAFLNRDEPESALRPRVPIHPGEDARFGLCPGTVVYARCAAPGKTTRLRATSIPS